MIETSYSFLLILGIIIFIFFLTGFSSQKLKISSVLAFLLIGIAAGYFFGDLGDALHYAAEIGIVFLFFLLGLEFPLGRMIGISGRIWPAGLLDVLLNFGAGYLIAVLFGLEWLPALLIGGIIYASSSSITIKMLEEKKRLAAPESEFILALLIFEDLVAPIMVSVLLVLSTGSDVSFGSFVELSLKIFILIAGAVLIGTYVFRKLEGFIEKYLENDIMPLFTVGIALFYAGIAVTLGLSEALGAFLAGVMLSETGRAKELEHLILPLRNLVLPFFFFWFGTTIYLQEGISMPGLFAALILWSIAAKILVGVLGGRLYGLSSRGSLRAGLSMIQRGEFSAIIASLALPQIRTLSGIYILCTAVIGMVFFNMAPRLIAPKHPQQYRRDRPKKLPVEDVK
jgi:monovalent cation:H+ antiporter-2, CPA2 family